MFVANPSERTNERRTEARGGQTTAHPICWLCCCRCLDLNSTTEGWISAVQERGAANQQRDGSCMKWNAVQQTAIGECAQLQLGNCKHPGSRRRAQQLSEFRTDIKQTRFSPDAQTAAPAASSPSRRPSARQRWGAQVRPTPWSSFSTIISLQTKLLTMTHVRCPSVGRHSFRGQSVPVTCCSAYKPNTPLLFLGNEVARVAPTV